MAEISLSRALSVVDQVAAVMEWNSYAGKLRRLFSEGGAQDAVEVLSGDPRYFVVKYTPNSSRTGNLGLLLFSWDCSVRDLISSDIKLNCDLAKTRYIPFMSVAHAFAAALGVPFAYPSGTLSSPLIQGAEAYSRCLMQATTEKQCETQKTTLREEAFALRLKLAIREIKDVWDKIDTFLKAAREADDNDSDLDVLAKIVARHSTARPIATPKTFEDAEEYAGASRLALNEFEASPSLEAFVREEGKCVKDYGPGKSCGRYKETCSLGGYSFYKYEETSCYKEDRSDRGRAR